MRRSGARCIDHAGSPVLLPWRHPPHQVGWSGQFQRPAQLQVDRLPAVTVRNHLDDTHLRQRADRMFLSSKFPAKSGGLHHQGKFSSLYSLNNRHFLNFQFFCTVHLSHKNGRGYIASEFY